MSSEGGIFFVELKGIVEKQRPSFMLWAGQQFLKRKIQSTGLGSYFSVLS